MEGLGFGFTVSLNDLFTNPLAEMVNKFKSLEGVSQDVVKKVEKQFDNFNIGQNLAIGGAVLAAPFAHAITTAIKYDDKLADIAKTTGLAGVELANLEKIIASLDTRTSLTELYDIAKIGGSLGVATNELGGFVKAADQLAVALGDEFGGGVENITKVVGTIKDLSKETKGLTQEEGLTRIGSIINELGASGRVNGAYIGDFATRILQLGSIAPSLNNTMALGATLGELGVTSEIAASGLSNVLLVAGENAAIYAKQLKMPVTAFRELYQNSPEQVILKLAESMKGLDDVGVTQTLKTLKVGTQESVKTFISLKDNVEMFSNKFEVANKAFQEGTSLSKEFNIKNNTLGALVDKISNNFEKLSLSIGKVVSGQFETFAILLNKLLDGLNEFAQTKIGETVIKITAALSGLLIAIGLGIMAQSAFNIVSLTAVPILTSWAGSMGLATTSMSAFVISALPLITTVGIIVGGIALMVKSWQSFSNVLNGTEQPTNGFMGFMQKLGGIIQGIVEVFSTANSEGFTIGENLHNALQSVGVLDTVVAIGTWVVRIKELFKGFFAAFDNFSFDPLLNAFNRLFSVFSKFDNTLAGNTTSLKKWETVGWFVGNLVEGVFRIILFLLENVVNWVTFAVSVIVTWVNSIVNLGITVYDLFSQWWNGAITTQDLFFGVVGAIKTYFLEMFTGITDAFKQMINSFAISIATLPFGQTIMSKLGFDAVALGIKEVVKPSMLAIPTNQFALGTPTTADTMLQNSTAAVQQQQQVRNEFYQNNLTQQPPVVNVANSQAPINVTMELNGETVGKAVVDYQQQNGARQ